VISQLFRDIFFLPILNLLVLLYKALLFVHIPGAFGFAIIGLTMIIRGAFNPFFKKQIETSKKMAELKPHLDKLSEKHKGDPKALQAQQMKLYQEAGINPASGCLVLIIQMPIFIALYQALYEPFKHGDLSMAVKEINKMVYNSFLKIGSIDPWFFGFNLSLTPKASQQWFYLLIPLLTGALQYFQAQVMTPSSAPSDKKDDGADFQKAMNTQMKFLFPLMIAWFSYTLPVGLSLYWNVFSLFSIFQYRQPKKLTVQADGKK